MVQTSKSISHKSKSHPQTSQNADTEFLREAVEKLHKITQELTGKFPKRKFTLDGRLLGDIGEIYANCIYDIVLEHKQSPHIDAVARNGKTVQIKITMRKQLLFPKTSHADYFLGLRIGPDHKITEIFNGPSEFILRTRNKAAKNNKMPYSISTDVLAAISKTVPKSKKLRLRS